MSVTLKPIESGEATRLASLANNKKIWDHVRDFFPHPYTAEHALEFIQSKGSENPPTSLGIYFMNDLVGVIGIDRMKDVFRHTGYLGYWIGEAYWGKGIATEAVKLMTTYGFETMKLTKIQAGVFDFNKPSMRVLEKAGFELEGILKKSAIKNGQVCDDYIYGVVSPSMNG